MSINTIYRHHHPAFFYRRRYSPAYLFLGLFLKNMFFLATAWFAASIAIRIVILTLSILFSPPVFVLLLLTFATAWWSFDALHHEHSPVPTTAFCGRRQQSPCCSRRGAGQRRRERCRRFLQSQQQQQQQQCQSQCQHEQSCQTRNKKMAPSSTSTEDSKSGESTNNNKKERLNNIQPKRAFNYFYNCQQRTSPFQHIEQDDQQVTLSIGVPGFSVGDLNITVGQDGTLKISGERRNTLGGASASFQRQFVMSPTTMDTTSVTANVVDGLLTITIAKKEIPKPRSITITNHAQENIPDEKKDLDEEEPKKTTIVFEKAPVEEDSPVVLLSAAKNPIAVETVDDDNDDNEDVQIEESDPAEGNHDSWEDVNKAY